MTTELIRVPDIGTGEGEVIEILVGVGDQIEAEQGLLTLESDKASMEIPAPKAGIVKSLKIKLGDRLQEGDELLELEVDSAAAEPDTAVEEPAAAPTTEAPAAEAPAPAAPAEAATTTRIKDVEVPDIGSAGKAQVIELLIQAGDTVEEEQALLTLESDKASMEIPSPVSGTVIEVLAKLNADVTEGDLICRIEVTETAIQAPAEAEPVPATSQPAAQPQPALAPEAQQEIAGGPASVAPASKPEVCKPGDAGACMHAGPAVRKLAREFGVDLGRVSPTGPHQRILKEDVQLFVQQRLSQPAAESRGGVGIEPIPEVDFSRFGEVAAVRMTRLQH